MEAKLALKQSHNERTVIELSPLSTCGGTELFIIGGPCSVESLEQMDEVALKLAKAPVQGLRGCIYKPRTSPYTFQGIGQPGLDIIQAVRTKYGVPVITEVMSCEQIESIAHHADVLQVGSRNMQNFELLKELGTIERAVLLKRGLSATVEELILAAEYILSCGNPNVILCERGIRSFDNYTRNVLDLGAVVALKQLTHLPVIVDPSHACGKREMVADLARAAIAAGADGLMIECHPQPEKSISDARQAISLEDMVSLVHSIKPIAEAVGRCIRPVSESQARQACLTPVPSVESTSMLKQSISKDSTAANSLSLRR